MNNNLIHIYNTLMRISTKGEDTVAMAQCLISLKQIIEDNHKEEKPNE